MCLREGIGQTLDCAGFQVFTTYPTEVLALYPHLYIM